MAMSDKKIINLIYTVGFLDLFGVSMLIPLLGRHARDLGASPTTIGILGSTYGCLQMFSSPVIGSWSDRAGRRTVLIWSLLLSSIGYCMLAMGASVTVLFLARIPTGLFKHSQEIAVAYLGSHLPKTLHAQVFGRFQAASSVGFIVGPVIGGHLADLPGGFRLVAMTSAAIFVVTAGIFKQTQNLLRTAVADVVTKKQQSDIFGRYNAISLLGFVIGPVVGGHLLEWPGTGFHIVAGATTGLFVLNAAIVWGFIPVDVPQPDTHNKQAASSTARRGASMGPAALLHSLQQVNWPRLWDLFAVRFLLGFAVIVYRSNFALSLDARFGTSGKQLGYVISFGSVMGTLSGLVVGRVAALYADDHNRLLRHASVLQMFSIASITVAPSLALLVIAMAPLSLANAVARVSITNLTLGRLQGDEAGAALGCSASVISLARMTSPVLAGLALESHAAGPAMMGVVSAFLGVVLLNLTAIGVFGHKAEKDETHLKKS